MFLNYLFTAAVYGQDAQVNAVLCGTQAPDVQLIQPVSDSVVNTPDIAIKATAIRTTQVDVFLNDEYTSSVAIGTSGQLATSLSLKQGTNTLKLEAHYSCNQAKTTVLAVVTYQPKAHSAAGTDTKTLKPGNTAPTIVSNPAGSLGEGQNDSYVKPIRNWLMLLIAIASTFVMLLPPYYLTILFGFFGWKKGKLTIRLQVLVRSLAAAVAIIFAIIVQA